MMSNNEKEININEIAKELAQLPEITDSNEWPHRNKIIYELNKPEKWAEICVEALNLTNNQILQIWLTIEFVNGRRRYILNADTLHFVRDILEEIKSRIDEIPRHLSYGRLLELWAYHSAYVYRSLREFNKAAVSHEFSYSIAKEKSVRSELLALYKLNFAKLEAAIADNKNVKEAMNDFYDACNMLISALEKTKEEDLRWMANACYNLMLYSWLIERKTPSKVGVSFLEKLPPNIRPIFEDQATILKAIAAIEKDPGKTIDLTGSIITADDEVRAMAMIVMAKAKLKMGADPLDLEEIKTLEKNAEKPGFHLAQAILKNLL